MAEAQLTAAQYRVTVLGEDDPDFDNAFHDHFEVGSYRCVGCQARLFESADKFEAGTGAPSFSRAVVGAVSVIHDPRPGHGDEQLIPNLGDNDPSHRDPRRAR